jgi:hypothetical protein
MCIWDCKNTAASQTSVEIRRKKADQDGLVPCSLQSEESSKEYSRNWAKLIQWICASAIDFNC